MPGLARISFGLALFGLSVAPARAEVGYLDLGGGYNVVNGPILLSQVGGPGENIFGLVQTGPLTTSLVSQIGFYSRSAVIQTGPNNLSSVTQFGDFSHAFVIQVGATNASSVAQTGNFGSVVVVQVANADFAAFGPAYLKSLASNLLYAPESAAALPSVAESSARALTRDVLSQLDTGRSQKCLDQSFASGLSQLGKARPDCRFAVFAQGNYEHGDHADSFGSTRYAFDAGGILVGAKYFATPNLSLGPVVSYTRTGAAFAQNMGFTNVDTVQVGGFGALDTTSLFIHAVGAYGWSNFDVYRPAGAGSVRAAPRGETATAAVKTGYLFDFDTVRVGPVGAFAWRDTQLGLYGESGDPMFTQIVGAQNTKALIASGGLRFRPVVAPYGLDAYLDVMAEGDARGNPMRVLPTMFTLAPGVPIFTPVQSKGGTYGRVAAGVGYDISPNARVGFSADGIFARRAGDSFSFNLNARMAF
jgi:outer membrane autotransporter protein